MRQTGWRLKVKRGIDIVGAAGGLALLSPAIALTSLSVRLSMGSPSLFRQERGGRNHRPFTLVKFRTMCEARGPNGELLPDHLRMTRTGQLLRSLSLDELPQLWNVLRGDMSLVGPRPHLSRYIPLYNARQATRHDVRPGLTGWAQVNGRNAVTYEERFEMDAWYVENWSLALDARILWLTLLTVVRRSGITSTDQASRPEFTGTPAPAGTELGTAESSLAFSSTSQTRAASHGSRIVSGEHG